MGCRNKNIIDFASHWYLCCLQGTGFTEHAE